MPRKKEDSPEEPLFELRDLDIYEVSVVDKPAVPGALFAFKKSQTGLEDLEQIESRFEIAKVDKKKKQVAGYALIASEGDWHGDIVYEEELEKAAWSFLRNMAHHWQWGTGTGEQHYKYTGVGWPIESVIDRNGAIARLHSVKAKKGSWWIRVQIVDDAVWEKIESGEITGFSIAGMARRILIEPDEDEDEKSLSKKVRELIDLIKRKAGGDSEENGETKIGQGDSGESTKSSTEGGTDVDEKEVRTIVQEEMAKLKTGLEESLAITVVDAIKAAATLPKKDPPETGGDEGETGKSEDAIAQTLTKLIEKIDGIEKNVDAIKRAPVGRTGVPADDVHGVRSERRTVVPVRQDGSGRPDFGAMGKGAFNLDTPDASFVRENPDDDANEGSSDEDDPPE